MRNYSKDTLGFFAAFSSFLLTLRMKNKGKKGDENLTIDAMRSFFLSFSFSSF